MSCFRINDGVVIDYTNEGWDEYKKWLDGTYALLLYAWVDEGLAYCIVATDGPFYRTCSINKSDAADFEANYKTTTPKPIIPRTTAGIPFTAVENKILGRMAFLRTDNGSELMNVNGLSAGSGVNIWNGEGGTDWTPTGTGSKTTESKHTGTYGWDTGSAAKDSNTIFTYGSNIDVSDYAQFSFWMQPKSFPPDSRVNILWQTLAGEDRGYQLDLLAYVSSYDLNVWQKVTIPLSDFSLGSNPIGRLKITYAKQAGQQFWFDEFEFSAAEGGGPYTFRVESPDVNTVFHVTMVKILVSAPGSGWNPLTFGSISALTNGLLLRQRRISDGDVLWSINSKDNIHLFGNYCPQDSIIFENGDLLVGLMIDPGKASILITNNEVLEFVVRDNLSTISQMRAFCHYGVEILT